MKKINLLCVLMIFSLVGKGQETVKSVIRDMNKNATVLDKLILEMEKNIKQGKYYEMLPTQVGIMNEELTALDQKLRSLDEPKRSVVATILYTYHTNVDNFKKSATNSSPDKPAIIREAFTQVIVIHQVFRDTLRQLFTNATKNEGQKTPDIRPESGQIIDQEQTASQPGVNTRVLEIILKSKQAITLYTDSVHLSLKKNNYGNVSRLARLISKNCLQIEGLSLLLHGDQQQGIINLAKGIRSYADALNGLSKKGAVNHHKIHEVLENIEIMINTLTTGLSLIH
jgi:hypothetical protein